MSLTIFRLSALSAFGRFRVMIPVVFFVSRITSGAGDSTDDMFFLWNVRSLNTGDRSEMEPLFDRHFDSNLGSANRPKCLTTEAMLKADDKTCFEDGVAENEKINRRKTKKNVFNARKNK